MPSIHAAPRRPPHGRREQRKHVTRRELLAAGRKLFGERGLYESRIEDLSRHAGVAKGTLYGYFPGKAALIEAVVSSGFAELLVHVHRRTEDARTRREVSERLVDAHLEFFEENPDLMRIFHQVRGLLKFDRPEGRPLRRVLKSYVSALARVLARKPAGSGRPRRLDLETATLLFGAVSGVASTRAALADGIPRDFRSAATNRALAALVLAFGPGKGGGRP
jgi:AcrR family transcriptional regulator